MTWYKSGEASDSTNYRPIAFLPFLSKIVERVITIRLNYFLEKIPFLEIVNSASKNPNLLLTPYTDQLKNV